MDFNASILNHTTLIGTGAFRNGALGGVSYADFDQSYTPINGPGIEGTFSRYMVQAGDTLESIAQQLWGDSSFWYMIADANGLHSNDGLVAGLSLIIPNKVHNSHNNTDTWRVYDPNEAIGDISPITKRKPPRKNGCGVFGMILMIAVAVAVTAISFGTLAPASSTVAGSTLAASTTAMGVAMPALTVPALTMTSAGLLGAGLGATLAAGALSAAAGGIASQGVGLAIGAQDKFSWKGVALSALSGGITAGLGGIGLLKGATGMAGTVQDGARGALGNALTQGIAVATGLQGRMNWAGVAVGGVVGGTVGGLRSSGPLVSGMAGAMAGAAARSLLTGTSFGDNIAAVLPDVVGATLGNLVAGVVMSQGSAVKDGPGAGTGGKLKGRLGNRAGAITFSELHAAPEAIMPGDLIVTAGGWIKSIGDMFKGTIELLSSSLSESLLVQTIAASLTNSADAALDYTGRPLARWIDRGIRSDYRPMEAKVRAARNIPNAWGTSDFSRGMIRGGLNSAVQLNSVLTFGPGAGMYVDSFRPVERLMGPVRNLNEASGVVTFEIAEAAALTAVGPVGGGVRAIGGRLTAARTSTIAANRIGGLSALEANAPHIAAGSRPPYAAGTRARDIVLENERMFVRVHGEGNQARSWMMRPHEIEGLSAHQIQNRFALPELPIYVSDVAAPAGTRIRIGTVGNQEGWGRGGGIQYELQQRLPASAFTNRRPLP